MRTAQRRNAALCSNAHVRALLGAAEVAAEKPRSRMRARKDWPLDVLCQDGSMKQGLDLNRVVLLGRTFEEYVQSFALIRDEYHGKSILDVAAGVSSFTAEANTKGLKAIAFDPIYDLPADKIEMRSRQDLDFVADAIGGLKVYRWDFYKDPEGMRRFRDQAWRTFLADYKQHGKERYVAGHLPQTPFRDGQFHLVLVSYLLFVYQDQLSYQLHKDAVLELMRVTSGELRIYPTVTFEARPSEYLDRLRADPELAHLRFETVKTKFEFLANSNSFLRVRRCG